MNAVSRLLFLFIVLFLGAVMAQPTWAGKEKFPEESLQVPEKEAYQEYLGVSDRESFLVQDVSSDLVLVEVFSMYCPICQREAENVHRLYQLIQDQGLGDNIKVLGIAPGNSSYEVSVFKERYNVPFPLFPDADYQWHEHLGRVGTPTFIVVDTADGSVLRSHTGPFEGPEEYLQILKDFL